MSTTTRAIMAVPLAAAALTIGAGPAFAAPAEFPDLDKVQASDPEPELGPQGFGPDDKDGPNPDDGPDPQDGPDDKDGPNPDDGPGPLDGPDDLTNPDGDDDDGDNDDGDNDDGDNDDGDNDDGDNDDGDNDDGDNDDNDDGDNDDGDGDKDDDDDVRRPTRVDAGDPSGSSMSLAWVLAGGAVISAAGSFAARKRLS